MKKNIILLLVVIPFVLFSQDEINNQYTDVYVVIADVSLDFEKLNTKMINLHESTGLEIKMMDRIYNKKKNLICLPDTHSDEIYAGDYFPRRFPDKSLSIEYLDFYDTKSEGEFMALVTGIFSEKKDAEYQLNQLKEISEQSYIVKANIFMGCMH